MSTEKKVAMAIFDETIIELIGEYKNMLKENKVQRYEFLQEFYINLDKEKKELFDIFLEEFAIDIVSIVLGGLDGSTKLKEFFGGFSVNYNNEEITPYLQDNFLAICEDYLSNK
ncbi:MAG: hypothetical protein Q4B95_10310 [Lonepinella koalarum]|nr:hypothetical protein [Lonepinella koalarum]